MKGLEGVLGHAGRIRVKVGGALDHNSSRHGGQSRGPGLYMLAVRCFGVQEWKFLGKTPSREACAKKSVKVKATGRTLDRVDEESIERRSQKVRHLHILIND